MMLDRIGWGCLLLALLSRMATPREAVATCPSAPQSNLDFLGPCGPSLQLPPWGNGAWSQPEYYTTIQTADVDGDGAAELLGRSAVGIEVHKFDIERGLWLPFLDADGHFVLTEFSDMPRPNSSGLPEWAWDKAQYYATIQAGDIDDDGRDEILGRSALGMVTWDYDPTSNSWSELPSGPGLNDAEGWDTKSVYSTIQTADIDGDGSAEVLARGFGGMGVWSFDGSSWTCIGSGGPFPGEDGKDWDNALYYATIQTANLDGVGPAELLGRGADGVRFYSWTGAQPCFTGESTWNEVIGSGPFSNADGFGHPQYYSTIQTADIDGNHTDELLGRSPDGMETWSWTGTEWKKLGGDGPFKDGNDNWEHPQYYSTIQLADIDGDNAAELIGRGAFGIEYWSWDGKENEWVRKLFHTPELNNSYAGEFLDEPITVPLWQEPHYYATIQTANIDGDDRAELLARGTFGIRTWRLDTSDESNPVWTRYKAYGYPSPAFPTAGQQAAYEDLGPLLTLGGKPPNDVRTNNVSGYGNVAVDVDTNKSLWAQYLSEIKATCSNQISEDPAQYQSCTPRAGSSGFDAADWTIVANEIIAELFYVQKAATFHDDMANLQNDLFVTDQADFDTILSQLKLDSTKTSDGNTAFLILFANITKTIAALAAPLAPDVGIPLNILGNLMGTVGSASPALASQNLVFEQTDAEALASLGSMIASGQDAIDEHQSLVRADPGMLTAVGGLVTQTPSTIAFWQVFKDDYRSTARQGFATWVYQTFLPLNWQLWVVTGCEDSSFLTCSPPENKTCDPKVLTDIGSCYLGEYKSGGTEFTGLFPNPTSANANGCTSSSVDGIKFTTCGWNTPPTQDLVIGIWGKNVCGFEWHYGSCNLALPTGPDSDIFNNRNGWKFPTENIPQASSATTVLGRVPIAPLGGHLVAAVTVPSADALDLRHAEVSLDRLLHERGGAGELAHDTIGLAIDPDSLLPTKAGAKSATFETFPGEEPRMRLKLREHRGQLEAQLFVLGLVARDPALCAGVTPSTDLWTSFTIDDGMNPPIEVAVVEPWECREKRNEDRELRAR